MDTPGAPDADAATLGALAALCARLARTSGRLEKRDQVAGYLTSLSGEDLVHAVAWLTGRPFPTSDPRVLNVRGLPEAPAVDGALPLTLRDVADAFAAAAEASGSGARRARTDRLAVLTARATEAERDLLWRIITGEMRTGVSDGVMLEAIARAAGAPLTAVRRAAMFLGDLSAVARAAREGGGAGLAELEPRLFVPLLPMLAELATDLDSVLAAHGGRTAVEFKYDGARIQVHADGERVAIWSRGLSDVTASLPDVAAAARGLSGAPFILDGEVVARDGGGRPLPFQELMRRFRRLRGVDAHAEAMPLSIYFFDCLVSGGRSLIDEPAEARWAALARITGGRHLAERRIVASAEEARAFEREALDAGHEGVMAKDLRSAYEPGGRGKRWFKLKVADTVDCVIVAADRGSGRRSRWLSNYHLAVRDGAGWAEVGKTFKGLTDAEFGAMTERLWALATEDQGYTVRVRPEVVVEVALQRGAEEPDVPVGLRAAVRPHPARARGQAACGRDDTRGARAALRAAVPDQGPAVTAPRACGVDRAEARRARPEPRSGRVPAAPVLPAGWGLKQLEKRCDHERKG